MKNSVKIFIVIICLIIVGVVTFFISKNVMKKPDVPEETKTTTNIVNDSEKNDTTSQESDNNLITDEDIVKELYLKKIQQDSENMEELIDYKIDNVEIIRESEKQSLLNLDEGKTYKDTDILAEVTFSVKPQDINSSLWIAGNGKIDGDWIVNKIVCVCVRDGKIISTGTSW